MKYKYVLPELPYSYDALEPYIDAKTMEIHYTKHHQAYINKLNKALENYPDLQQVSLEDLLKDLQDIPEEVQTAIRNNGGGHENHSMFWLMMAKNSSDRLPMPSGKLKEEIEGTWGHFDKFKEEFSNAAKTRFGSGWAWLSLDKSGNLVVTSTANQDNPISEGLKPILGLDVWEHAYYLKYQNKRVDYIDAWWHVVNWEQIQENYKKA